MDTQEPSCAACPESNYPSTEISLKAPLHQIPFTPYSRQEWTSQPEASLSHMTLELVNSFSHTPHSVVAFGAVLSYALVHTRHISTKGMYTSDKARHIIYSAAMFTTS